MSQFSIIRQGFKLSETHKQEIFKIFEKSEKQKVFINQAEYISHKLNEAFGPQWVVFLWEIGLNYNYSFFNKEEQIFEFEASNKRCLIIQWNFVKQEAKPTEVKYVSKMDWVTYD